MYEDNNCNDDDNNDVDNEADGNSFYNNDYMKSELNVFCVGLMCIKDMDGEALRSADMPFSTTSATGHETQLSTKYARITPDNRHEYVHLALAYR